MKRARRSEKKPLKIVITIMLVAVICGVAVFAGVKLIKKGGVKEPAVKNDINMPKTDEKMPETDAAVPENPPENEENGLDDEHLSYIYSLD